MMEWYLQAKGGQLYTPDPRTEKTDPHLVYYIER